MGLRHLFAQLTLEFAGAAHILQRFSEYSSCDILEHVHQEVDGGGIVADDPNFDGKVLQWLLAELEDMFVLSGRMIAVGLVPKPTADSTHAFRMSKSPD
jgi:hypothetical protein